MKQCEVTGLEAVKRTHTAELRRRYDYISNLPDEGNNHKQTCEHLNKQGRPIPYAQYRAIMTRLRREKSVSSNSALNTTRPIVSRKEATLGFSGVVPMTSTDKPKGQDAIEKKIIWNPMSKIKWK